MRVFLFLILFSFFGNPMFGQNLLDTPVSLKYSNESLGKILNDLKKDYDLNFSYATINLSVSITISFKGKLQEALDELFAPESIHYKMIGNQIALKYVPIKGRPIKGQILDADTQVPLIGANVILDKSDPLVGVSTDIDGYFSLQGLAIGRYNLRVQFIGYEPIFINQVLVTAGKDVFLALELKESTVALAEVVVKIKRDVSKPLNDMATTSARSFSVEESQRFAAAISDPARMAQSYAGVSSGGDDLSNEIIIRGNSPRGLLWRLEGVEIPSPNHFAGYVSGGGSISMLSANTMSNSDFYTGAFPAEYGNALSGVFDLRMRNGNKDKREHTLAIGNLGLEAATEGYFSKNSNASYLFNFRYSTLQFVNPFLPSLEGSLPSYRDLSFKINVPTKKAGLFSIFGIGGINKQYQTAKQDTALWVTGEDRLDRLFLQKLGIIGFNHRYLLSDNSYLSTSLMASVYDYYDLTDLYLPEPLLASVTIDETSFFNADFVGSISLNHKFNAKHNIRTGFSFSPRHYTYDFYTILTDSIRARDINLNTIDSVLTTLLGDAGQALYFQSYFQSKYHFSEKWTLHSGINFSWFFLNNTFGIDPRLALRWNFKEQQSLSMSLGLHSKPEHSSTYLIKQIDANGNSTQNNLGLKMPRAFHAVLAYDRNFSKHLRLKVEPYYQYLFNIPVSTINNDGFSALNVTDIFDITSHDESNQFYLVSEGTGFNYGIDFTLEKFFSEGYYFLTTASIFDSKYTTRNGDIYSTRNANNYILNLLGGKEWFVGKDKNNVLGLNGKFTFYDGNRDTPIDLATSILERDRIDFPLSYYTIKLEPYIRFDLGISYKINTPSVTHTFMIDLQNIGNRKNVSNRRFDSRSGQIINVLQNGLIPFVTYRVDLSYDKKSP